MSLNEQPATLVAKVDKCVRMPLGASAIEDFYLDLFLWNELERFYQKYPQHPYKWIHEEAEKRLNEF